MATVLLLFLLFNKVLNLEGNSVYHYTIRMVSLYINSLFPRPQHSIFRKLNKTKRLLWNYFLGITLRWYFMVAVIQSISPKADFDNWLDLILPQKWNLILWDYKAWLNIHQGQIRFFIFSLWVNKKVVNKRKEECLKL